VPIPGNFNRDVGHGRIETRLAEILPFSIAAYPETKLAVRMTRTRQQKRGGYPTENYSEDVSYYLSTIPAEKTTLEAINPLIRGYRAVENKLHPVKDRTMKEDRYRAQDAVAATFALIRSCIVTCK